MSFISKTRSLFTLFKQAIKGDQQDYTSGSIDRAIILLSIPMILEMLMESLFAIVDVFYVSKLGVNAVATVGLTESMLTLVYSVAIGLSMGATALVARRVGEKNISAASLTGMQAIYLALGISILVSIGGIIYADELLRMMGAENDVIAQGVSYTKWIFGGNITIMLLFLINAVFRGAGDASLAMRSLLISNSLNIVLDPLLIFGFWIIPAFGIEGAGIATTIGRGIGVLYQLYHLIWGRGLIKISRKNFGFDFKFKLCDVTRKSKNALYNTVKTQRT